MGAALRKSDSKDNGPASTRRGTADGEPTPGDDTVQEISPENAQQLAHDEAEEKNARLKEKRKSSGNDAASPEGRKARKEKEREKEREKEEQQKKERKEQKWNKPSHAVVAAALLQADDDTEVETIDVDEGHSFATSNKSPDKRREEDEAKTASPGVGSTSNTRSPTNSTGLVNPWSRPSLFTRNFQSESANAELFVSLARSKAQELQAHEKKSSKKSKSSIVVEKENKRASQRSAVEDDDF